MTEQEMYKQYLIYVHGYDLDFNDLSDFERQAIFRELRYWHSEQVLDTFRRIDVNSFEELKSVGPCVYAYRNKIDSSVYVGQTKDLYHRHYCHLSANASIFDYRYSCKNMDNFQLYVLKECDQLIKWENNFITLFCSCIDGYNTLRGYIPDGEEGRYQIKLMKEEIQERMKAWNRRRSINS